MTVPMQQGKGEKREGVSSVICKLGSERDSPKTKFHD